MVRGDGKPSLEALSSDAVSVLPMDLDQDRDRDLVVVGQQGLWVIETIASGNGNRCKSTTSPPKR